MSLLGVWFLTVGGIRFVPSLLRIMDSGSYPWPAAPIYYASLTVGALMITGAIGYLHMQRWGAWTLVASWLAFFGTKFGFENDSTAYFIGVGIVVAVNLGVLWATCAVRWSAFK